MNQISSVSFGADATRANGYLLSAGERLGNFDLVLENVGPNAAYVKLMQYDGVTSPSGFAVIGTPFTVAAGGVLTKSYSLIGKRVGLFGSGNTLVNVSTVLRNKADLRGAQIDLVVTGRRGWGYDEGWQKNELKKKWGSVSVPPTTSGNINAGSGAIDSTQEGV